MAAQTQFPLFAPPPFRPDPQRPITEIRFSRWNNANAQKYVIPKRIQKELEDQIRIEKRFDSALTIAHNYSPAPPYPTTSKSTGTPSVPSSPSIPGKASKYSKPPAHTQSHPAFEPLPKPPKLPQLSEAPNFRIDENGVSYELPDAPFLYQYSYTETPKVKPVKLREPLVSPFGPTTMAKPWLGRKPLPPSKKKLPEFDSFQLPPPHKKGVKPVQAPGPFLPGSGPKYVRSREEILGAPLSKEEIEDLINGSKKSSRQLNIGRDGLTHNMLDNIHALWKRRRVCKIKCKGVCTVDMNNVCQQLEEKTGGKIIFQRGGVIYLFRGRNYNYKSRPRYPLMLWKPISPVYPRLIKRVPEGLTLEEATEMRRKGRDLIPICKLGKNGVYCDLVKNVREAFEACELVRINCQGMNPSDYKKIGAKLKDLVPCVLLSFDFEHILMWRGREWKSSLTIPNNGSSKGLPEVTANATELVASPLPPLNSQSLSSLELNVMGQETNSLPNSSNDEESEGTYTLNDVGEEISSRTDDASIMDSHMIPDADSIDESSGSSVLSVSSDKDAAINETHVSEMVLDGLVESQINMDDTESSKTVSNISSEAPQPLEKLTNEKNYGQRLKSNTPLDERILLLQKQALESGMALVLDENCLDADTIFKEAAAFAKIATPSPAFQRRSRNSATQEKEERASNGSRPKEDPTGLGEVISGSTRRDERKTSRNGRMRDIKGDYLNVAPKGSLRVDELAKLLA